MDERHEEQDTEQGTAPSVRHYPIISLRGKEVHCICIASEDHDVATVHFHHSEDDRIEPHTDRDDPSIHTFLQRNRTPDTHWHRQLGLTHQLAFIGKNAIEWVYNASIQDTIKYGISVDSTVEGMRKSRCWKGMCGACQIEYL